MADMDKLAMYLIVMLGAVTIVFISIDASGILPTNQLSPDANKAFGAPGFSDLNESFPQPTEFLTVEGSVVEVGVATVANFFIGIGYFWDISAWAVSQIFNFVPIVFNMSTFFADLIVDPAVDGGSLRTLFSIFSLAIIAVVFIIIMGMVSRVASIIRGGGG